MKVLLINPPIYDFSAYNLWAKPIALLKIANILKKNGIDFTFYDALDVSSLTIEEKKKYKIKIKPSGRHNYIKILSEKPECLAKLKRKYFRFGTPPEKMLKDFSDIQEPDYIIVTSVMTYWYKGAFETINMLKKIFPKSKIIFGGVYVNLCYEHAFKKSNANFIVRTIDEILTILNLRYYPFDRFPLELYKTNYFAPIYTSSGCPYSCVYCANKFLNKPFSQRNIGEIFNEILFYREQLDIRNFAFYDDALLINKKNHFLPLIKTIIEHKLDISFYTPNGLHVSEIDYETAILMKKANFKDIRLSLETANEQLQKKIGYKTDNKSFIKAINNLKKAGFQNNEISVYLLVGLPYQKMSEIKTSVEFVKDFNVKVKLAEYSPIPHTLLWNEAIKVSKYDIINEPLFHNNKILPVSTPNLSIDELNRIKSFAHLNNG